LLPAGIDEGIRFRRVDLPGRPEVRALACNVTGTARATTIADGDAVVHTTEHLLAALYALGVDNAVIEMNGPEPPVMDGSAAPFVALVREAGVVAQDAEREFLDIQETLVLESGETIIVVTPDPDFRISCTVKYNSTPLDCQYLSLKVTPETFVAELCEARTFCLYHEIEHLMTADLIRGGSLDNAVVIKGDAIISKDGLRYPDEFVRHKILDTIGDLFLVGRRMHCHVIAVKPGHPTNVAMAQRIVEKAGVTHG